MAYSSLSFLPCTSWREGADNWTKASCEVRLWFCGSNLAKGGHLANAPKLLLKGGVHAFDATHTADRSA